MIRMFRRFFIKLKYGRPLSNKEHAFDKAYSALLIMYQHDMENASNWCEQKKVIEWYVEQLSKLK